MILPYLIHLFQLNLAPAGEIEGGWANTFTVEYLDENNECLTK